LQLTPILSEPPWNVGYVCKKVDESSPVLATQLRWIEFLARDARVEHVYVLTPSCGATSLPENVTVRAFGRPARSPIRRLASVYGFYRELLKISRPLSFFFVAQGGPYPALLLPWKLLCRRPVHQWKAMPHVTGKMRFYAKYCDDLIFTATPSSFPFAREKVRVVGHGIDTELFRPRRGTKRRDLVIASRIAPVKGLDRAVRALAACRSRYGVTYRLDIIGPCDTVSREYRQDLLGLIDELDLQDQVRLMGGVEQHELARLMGEYRAALNFSDTAFDKAAGEAMAMGIPVVTTNPSALEVIPPDLANLLGPPRDDLERQARAIHEVLSMDDRRREGLGERLRAVILENHSLDALFGKVLGAISEEHAKLSVTAGRGWSEGVNAGDADG